jgi:hypothetical protein
MVLIGIISQKNKQIGCYALAGGKLPDPSKTFLSSGNFQIDQVTAKELNFISSCFLTRPGFYFYDEGNGKNAFATKSAYLNGFPDGTIFFGKTLFNSEYIKSLGGTTIPIIIAHEFGHIVDFKFGALNSTGMKRELFADFLAGAYMSVRTRSGFANTDIYACFSSFEELGDTNFGDPDHHGTPEQREDALSSGFYYMENGYTTGVLIGLAQIIKAAKTYVSDIEDPVDPSVKDIE